MLPVPSYLLRVKLEDRPGSLGSLAVALGSVGADILSLNGNGSAIGSLKSGNQPQQGGFSTTSWSN